MNEMIVLADKPKSCLNAKLSIHFSGTTPTKLAKTSRKYTEQYAVGTEKVNISVIKLQQLNSNPKNLDYIYRSCGPLLQA